MNSNANVMETVGQAVSTAGEVARTVAGRRAKLENTLEAAKASLHKGHERVKTGARHATEGADEYVHSNPWSAIGIAAAVGAAIAVLLSTRMHR